MDLTDKERTIESKNGLLHRLEDKLVHFDQQFEVYDGMIKDFQEQKKLVLQKEEQIVAKQVELDWFKRLNSDK
jgi:predicted N-acyltransferase